MFKSLFRLIVMLLVLGGWGLAAASLHVIRTPSHIALIPKDHLAIENTYVDTRGWSLADLAGHAQVVHRLFDTGHADILRYLADAKKGDVDQQLHDAVAGKSKAR